MPAKTILGVAFLFLFAQAALAEPKQEKALPPVEARLQLGKQILVEMEVRVAKDRLEKRGEIFLDSETNFRDERNFAAVITRRGAESLTAKGIRDIVEHFQGKVIQVRGLVTEVGGVPRIEIDDAQQIRRVETPVSP